MTAFLHAIPLRRLRAGALIYTSFLVLFFMTGCATPVGTRSAKIHETYKQLSKNSLNQGGLSDLSNQVLNRFNLADAFNESPGGTIEKLHSIACTDSRRELRFALSELSYHYAKRTGNLHSDVAKSQKYYLASAVYAYFFLFEASDYAPPGPYDRKLRFACDLYNASLSKLIEMFKYHKNEFTGTHRLPVGKIAITIDQEHFPHILKNITKILPADMMSVRGLSVRNRLSGIGAPFVAVEKQNKNRPIVRSFPGTLFLRVDSSMQDLAAGGVGRIELYSSYEKEALSIAGKHIPLEKDLSAQLAYNLNQSFLWDMGMMQFFKGAITPNGVYQLEPYSPGRIPVVFVHGTFSSPAPWAEMVNTLRADPLLWDKYQFWFYVYDSGKPIILSSSHLRSELTARIKKLDPAGKDSALKQMVVIGHSQGGLLTKMTAVHTDERWIQSITGAPLEDLDLSEETKQLIKKYMIIDPLPFVRRVVFISTPHRGSYLSMDWVRNLVKKIISFPARLMKLSQSIALATAKLGGGETLEVGTTVTSLDGMSPNNKGLLALAELPVAPGIKAHSIIPINGDETPPDGDDGVVKYTSAHIDYAVSEFIVRDEHSCQSTPLVIEEVRRILLEHLNQVKATN